MLKHGLQMAVCMQDVNYILPLGRISELGMFTHFACGKYNVNTLRPSDAYMRQ